MYIGDNRRHPRTGSDGLCPTDSELLRSARDGDTAAFHQLVDRHAADLFRLACAMTGNTADAEDALQETFMGAFQRMSSFAGRSSVRTWLVGILSRQAARSHRRRLRRPAVAFEELRLEPGTDARTGPATGSGAHVAMDVREALANLSSEHRQVIVLRELQGMTYAEIAQALRVPLGTVESRIYRARQQLRDRLADYLPEAGKNDEL